MDHPNLLNAAQVNEIKTLASETRRSFGVHQIVPVGNDIRMVLERKGILLCEYPFSESEDPHTYGNIVMFKAGENTITFIGLNSACYYDEQIFAIAHEIYHYSTRTGRAFSKEPEGEDRETERMADRFAAEFLLPADALADMVASFVGDASLANVSDNKLLRFIARIQSDWWLPFRAVINRLFEEGYITKEQHEKLYEMDCRSENSAYRRILKSTDNEISELLNTKTRAIGVSPRVVDTIIDNYEDGYIDDDEFARLLELIGKDPEDYGFMINVTNGRNCD